MNNLQQFIEKKCKEFENKLLHEWVNQIDYDDIQNAKDFLRQSLTECAKATADAVRGELPKVITPTVEPPQNKLSQNQIFAGGQMNMLIRTKEIIESKEQAWFKREI